MYKYFSGPGLMVREKLNYLDLTNSLINIYVMSVKST